MDKEIKARIAEEIRRVDEAYWSLVDVLDVKASVVLVAITFLGALSGQILSIDDLPLFIKVLQILAILMLCVAGVLILRCLWLREVLLPPNPDELITWVKDLKAYQDKEGGALLPEFEKHEEEAGLERIKENKSATLVKTSLLKWSFRVLTLGVALEFGSLLALASRALGYSFFSTR
jgi:hypothetical protein